MCCVLLLFKSIQWLIQIRYTARWLLTVSHHFLSLCLFHINNIISSVVKKERKQEARHWSWGWSGLGPTKIAKNLKSKNLGMLIILLCLCQGPLLCRVLGLWFSLQNPTTLNEYKSKKVCFNAWPLYVHSWLDTVMDGNTNSSSHLSREHSLPLPNQLA